MEKRYLYTPGPTQIPQDINLTMADQIPHHRSPEFKEMFKETLELLKYLFQTKRDVLVFTNSGTGAMEAAIVNFFKKGDKVLVIISGKFGQRWKEIAQVYGLQTITIDLTWGEPVEPKQVEEILKQDSSIKGVLVQASETSSAVSHPIKELGEIVKNYPQTLLVVDAISALGAMELKMDEFNIDIMVTGSQKTLMLPPGLAFLCFSKKAEPFLETSDLPKYYFDIKKMLKAQQKNQTAYTPAISLIMGLNSILKQIKKEGLESIIKNHLDISYAVREAVKALGLKLLNEKSPTTACTAVVMPEGIDGNEVVKEFRNYGITIAGGQAHLKGKIIRLGHLGYITKTDAIIMIGVLEAVLSKLGYNTPKGKGIAKIQEILF